MRVTRRGFLLGCLAVGVVATPAAWYGGIYEPGDIEVVRRRIGIPKLPSKLDGLTAVQISDLHLNGTSDVHSRMVAEVKKLKPDVILFTGDLIDEQSALADGHAIFASWQPPLGIWAVPGNWDHTATNDQIDLLTRSLESAKVQFLVNRSAQLEDGLWLAGVDDPSSSHEDIGDAMRDIPSSAARILLAHSPDIVNSLQDTTFGLVLAGHTHGGQVNLPFFNGAWLKDGASHEYVQGLYDVHGSPLYVNRGIGTTTLPIRLGARPEITQFTLHAA
jgi:predicted MPP superfamily phosphohydrolase